MAKKQQTETPSDALRQAIASAQASGTTLYRIAVDSGVDYSTLRKFLNRERGISVETLDKLSVHLGLALRSK